MIAIHVDDASLNLVTILSIVSKNNEIGHVDFRRPTLNDVFLRFTGKNILEHETPEGGFMEKYARYNNK